MRISDEQIRQFKRDGFLIVESFLSEDEKKAALRGFCQWFAPPYEEWLAVGKENNRPQIRVFPWDDSGLNLAMTHPDLIDAAERIIGTREIRLSEWHLSVKYYAMDKSPGTEMLSIWIMETIPSALSFNRTITSIFASAFHVPGHRMVGWAGFSRKDRPWDGARSFTYKSGADYRGMSRFIAEATPRQLELIGFPPPGDELWTESFLEGMAKRYPGFNLAPYRHR